MLRFARRCRRNKARKTQPVVDKALFAANTGHKSLNTTSFIAQNCSGYEAEKARLSRGARFMEELLCNVEFLKSDAIYLARVQSELGGLREYRSPSLEEILEQVIIDLQEEFESSQL
jgi:hypothetical protein